MTMDNGVIGNIIQSGKPALIGRFGTVEFEALYYNQQGMSISVDRREVLEKNAGIFPADKESVKKWSIQAAAAMCSADVLAVGWFPPIVQLEANILAGWNWNGVKIPLRALEPYYVNDKWTMHLRGSVCVVSSFAHTAEQQVSRNIWTPKIWPDDIQWHWVRTGYAPSLALGRAGWDGLMSWQEAVDWTVAEVVKTGAQTVLIGCGGLGMLIGAELKRRGHCCIVMGGAIQVLFGIKGLRWKDHEISKFWNSEWVWPSLDETPGGADQVENGCYWGLNSPRD